MQVHWNLLPIETSNRVFTKLLCPFPLHQCIWNMNSNMHYWKPVIILKSAMLGWVLFPFFSPSVEFEVRTKPFWYSTLRNINLFSPFNKRISQLLNVIEIQATLQDLCWNKIIIKMWVYPMQPFAASHLLIVWHSDPTGGPTGEWSHSVFLSSFDSNLYNGGTTAHIGLWASDGVTPHHYHVGWKTLCQGIEVRGLYLTTNNSLWGNHSSD